MTGLFSLNAKDFLRGALMAIIVPVLYIVQTSIDAGDLTFKWKQIAMAGIGGFVGYLIKNFFTDDVKAAQKTIVKAEEKAVEDAQKTS